MPSVSPSAPMRRTSFAVISSLSRFSLSFALIVQHLQAKKIPYKDTRSPHGYPFDTNMPKARLLTRSTTGVQVRAESSALFFTRTLYHIPIRLSSPFSNFFKLFQTFFKTAFPYFGTTKMSMENYHKKDNQNIAKILLCRLCDENFCRFSSQLNIYKRAVLVYNITC